MKSKYGFKQFIDTHVHTHYSMLDGVSSPTDNVKRAKELGMDALAISDHGTLAGIYEFYKACKKNSITPIIGNELYWQSDFLDTEYDKSRKYHHGCFFAINEIGFKNLLHLSSIGFDELHYQYSRPVVKQSEIIKYSEGLLYSTGCMIGILGTSHKKKFSEEEVHKMFKPMVETFKDRMLVEIGPEQVCMDWDNKAGLFKPVERNDWEYCSSTAIPHTNCLQIEHNIRAIRFAQYYNLPLVVASDGHMTGPELKPVQDCLIKSASKGWHFHQIHSMLSSDIAWEKMQKNHSYVNKSLFEECIDNTYLVKDLVKDLNFNFSPIVPKYPLEKHPLYKSGMSSKELMFEIIQDVDRLPKDDNRYIHRIKEEIGVICDNGTTDYTDYFLILADIARYAGNNNVGMGPARGSAGGCLLSYLLGITSLDPIKYNLSFVRFLNEGRLGTPIVDFEEVPFEEWKKSKEIF